MTWTLNISGHQGNRSYGSDEHKRHEREVIAKAQEFIKTLADHSPTVAHFNGNTTGDVDLLRDAD